MADAKCFDDLNAFGIELNDPLEELAQDLYHRLIEEAGSNLDDPDRGLGIISRLNGPLDPHLDQDINSEFCKDDRVTTTSTLITAQDLPGSYRVEITVVVDTQRLGLVVVTDGLGGIERVTA